MRNTRRGLLRRRRPELDAATVASAPVPLVVPDLDIAPNDPLLPVFQEASGPVDISALDLDSPALEQMREAGVMLVVPLVASGELIGLLNLGPRLSERGYSSDDRQLLGRLAGYAAPAMRVGQLVREQQSQARTRERIDQELKVAQLIQQQFLPKAVPDLPSWHVAAFYRPARTIGGDFYDFITLPDGRVMIVVGDVTDKGVPAALVMASTHALLRSNAVRLLAPGQLLATVNDLLCDDIPAHMFVTCLVLVLDPATGNVVFANAGHNLPYLRTSDGVIELRATGMPLGLMPGMKYDENTAVLQPGECLLLHSDGLAEAHNSDREMFGFPRLADIVSQPRSGEQLIDACMAELADFTAADAEQEDDITLVTLERLASAVYADAVPSDAGPAGSDLPTASVTSASADECLLGQFAVASVAGNERVALEQVADAVRDQGLSHDQLERLKTAVAEATMNAIEHGNANRAELDVDIKVFRLADAVAVTITDDGGAPSVDPPMADPDLDKKLAGEQTPRGWGLFLIKHMVDAMDVSTDGAKHTVRLTIHVESTPIPLGKEAGDDEQV
ncbi:MAG: phosphoserine phosphatase RsbU/P [Frankiaceae bacterium]|jgi:serine phosphatase RsbU (regulator of sigma subunit)/anti-sigma regulatory factor (Ser/Thr protein kinase)|nr:phosphoserine phosphatase RsbU/P [Frankiaceae bacterium]